MEANNPMELTLTLEMVARMNRFYRDSAVLRAHLCEGLNGNPLGASVREFGSAVAIKYLDGGFIHANRVFGLGVDDLGSLDTILRFYREDAQRCDFQLNDQSIEPETALRLAERSLLVTSPISTQYGVPTAASPPPPGVTVRRADGAAHEECLQLFMDVFEVSPEEREEILLTERLENSQPGSRLYIASVDGVSAAAASMDIRDGIGHLTAGATLPPFRRRGCQAALIQRRLADALEEGCNLAVGNAAPYSGSRQNMERAGMRTALLGLVLTDCSSLPSADPISG